MKKMEPVLPSTAKMRARVTRQSVQPRAARTHISVRACSFPIEDWIDPAISKFPPMLLRARARGRGDLLRAKAQVRTSRASISHKTWSAVREPRLSGSVPSRKLSGKSLRERVPVL